MIMTSYIPFTGSSVQSGTPTAYTCMAAQVSARQRRPRRPGSTQPHSLTLSRTTPSSASQMAPPTRSQVHAELVSSYTPSPLPSRRSFLFHELGQGTNNVGELFAVGAAAQLISQVCTTRPNFKHLYVLTDSSRPPHQKLPRQDR